MKADAFSLPKCPPHNEDIWHIPEGNAPIVLCDGASESYDSHRWAEILAQNLHKSEDFNAAWLKDRIAEFHAGAQLANLGWAQMAAFARGSYAAFLSVELRVGGSIVNCIGDSLAVAVNRQEILDRYPQIDGNSTSVINSFSKKPELLSTNPRDNSLLLFDENGESARGYLSNLQAATHILMLSDALALWLLEAEAESNCADALPKLLDVATAADFAGLVQTERTAKRLRLDDTTMIRIPLRQRACLPPDLCKAP